MKKYFLLLCMLCAFAGNAFAQTIYDVFTYTEPKGYKKEIAEDHITFKKTNSKTGSYCIIGIYAQVVSIGDIKQDFDADWQQLVVKSLGVKDVPKSDNGDSITGWKTYTGAANFDFNGATFMALLTTAKNGNAKANIFIVTNSQALFKDVDLFFGKLKLAKPNAASSNIKPVIKPNTTTNHSTDKKIELWMVLKLKGLSSGINGDIPLDAADAEFYALFPNGSYYPYYHQIKVNENLVSNSSDSWGKYERKVNKIIFKSKYDFFEIIKKTETQYSKEGSVFIYYKCANVDGLKLQGGWTTTKSWRENPYNQGDCRPVIYFGTDGSFIDRGAFIGACGSPMSDSYAQPGEGTYSISNFTLTLKYNDGRTVSRTFSGSLDNNPANKNALLYLSDIPFYKDEK